MNLGQKIKYIKETKDREELNKITQKLPKNEEVCKEILRLLGNETVTIETIQEEGNTTSLYLVASNKILIGNMEQNFMRIQTIAHECIHSIQKKNKLLFHLILANFVQFYLIFSIVLCLIFKKEWIDWSIFASFLLLSLTLFFIRYSLEKDAMLRAKNLAKQYMEQTNLLLTKEIEMIVEEYTKMNKIGVPLYRDCLIGKVFVKVGILLAIVLIF